jgi:hypothetical protein
MQDIDLRQPKIVFTGSAGAGKTTAINAISEVPTINTDVKATEEHAVARKSTTTVAMDYGSLTLSEEVKLHLYGTPGQRRFDFMCHVLTKGALGLIILIDNTHPDPMDELDYYLNLNAGFLRDSAAVVGITHYDLKSQPNVADYYECLLERGDPWPVVHVDAREPEDVSMLIQTLMAQLEFG